MKILESVKAAANGAADRSTKAKHVAEAICTSGPYRWVGIYDVTVDTIAMVAYSGPTKPAYPTFPSTKGLSGEAVRLRQAIVSNDVSRDPRYLTALDTTGS